MNKYTVYTQPGCRYCHMAVDLLLSKGINPVILDINANQDARTHIVENGFKTVPQIYRNTDHIGGYEALVQYMETANAQ